ncbi:helix-turn-helix domain-containing protein [Sinosporangium siamense]|uniref:HTH cro/C1-type domain-containing protein n=1 Tax=Sinosporangium siamense TaxID=1367973 RepID=A0A919RJ90_9ACTN|nr:helix-turn-helix transcriptional regulator [Sinosporangium siamense]GII94870.1 hypothetical protein Ssi02_51010 [Sinosporangium siamense]
MTDVPRMHLVNRRRHQGFTQQSAAEAVGVTTTTWARWERGQQGIRVFYWPKIAAVLGVELGELGLLLEVAVPTRGQIRSTGMESVIEEAISLWRSEMEPNRRALLAAMPFMPSALGEWLLSYVHDAPPSTTSQSGGGAKVGFSDAVRIDEAVIAFKRMDSQFGAGLVRPAVVEYLQGTVAPLLKGSFNDEVGRRLLSAAARMTSLAGWTAFDMERHGQAQQHFGQALSLAKASGDSVTSVRVLERMAMQAFRLDERRWAQRLTHAGLESARRPGVPPAVTARGLVLHAQALAMAGQPGTGFSAVRSDSEVERLLGEAERILERDDRDLGWGVSFDTAWYLSEAASVWGRLGHYRRALECAGESVASFENTRTRAVQFTRLQLASARLGAGDVEQALTDVEPVVLGARSLTSARLTASLRRFVTALEPYSSTVQVREFRDRLKAELSA